MLRYLPDSDILRAIPLISPTRERKKIGKKHKSALFARRQFIFLADFYFFFLFFIFFFFFSRDVLSWERGNNRVSSIAWFPYNRSDRRNRQKNVRDDSSDSRVAM